EEYRQQCWNPWPACNVSSNVNNGGLDFDMGTTNNIAQYNYIHDNPMNDSQAVLWIESWDVGFSPPHNNAWSNNILRYNILENNYQGIMVNNSRLLTNINSWIYNNTIQEAQTYVNSDGGGTCLHTHNTDIPIYNNNCINTEPNGNGAFVEIESREPLDYNNYYSTSGVYRWCWFASTGGPPNSGCKKGSSPATALASWQSASLMDAHSLIVNPGMNGTPGTAGTCWAGGTSPPAGPQPCPSVYGLATGSPLIGAGLDLTQAPYNLNVGTQD